MRGGISWDRKDGKPVETTGQQHGQNLPVIANEMQVFRILGDLKGTGGSGVLAERWRKFLPEIRNFRVKMRRGLFWYYFEEK